MAENQNLVDDPLQPTQPIQERVIFNESPTLVGDYVNPMLAPMQSTNIYPSFGQANFFIQLDVNNIF